MPWGMRAKRESDIVGPVAERQLLVPKPCRSDRFYVPEFAGACACRLKFCEKDMFFNRKGSVSG